MAERLGWPFVDLDERIATAAGKPVPAIFAEDGELAFRDLETAACREVARETGLVVATGGGAVLRATNREALTSGGTVVCLEATPEAILQRVGSGTDRPMLGEGDRAERIRQLLAERAEAYARLPHHVDTTGLTVEQVADRILALTAGLPEGAQRIRCARPRAPDGGYDVLIAEGILAEAGARIAAPQGSSRAAAPSSPIRPSPEHHLPRLLSALRPGWDSSRSC